MPEEPRKLSKLAESLVADLRCIAGEAPPRSVKRATQPRAAVVAPLWLVWRLLSAPFRR